MAQSPKRTIFGIQSIAFYNPKTLKFHGILEVLGNGTFEMTGDQIKLNGGGNKFAWAVEQGNLDANINLTMKEYPDFAFGLFLGKMPTKIAASATGEVSAARNVKGTSVINAVNGISAIIATAGASEDLKFGKYTVEAISADEVVISASASVDFNRGVQGEYLADDLSIGSEEIVVGPNVVAGYGFTLTGVGVPAFVVGDTATFEVLPPHDGAMEVVVGGLGDSFPTFGAIIVAQKSSTGELFEIDCPNCSGAGMNVGGAEKAFTETPLTAAVSYDVGLGGIAKIRAVKAVTE